MVFSKYDTLFTAKQFIQMLEENVPALLVFHSSFYGKAICDLSKRAAAPLTQGVDSWNKWASWWTGQLADWWQFLIGTYWPESKAHLQSYISNKRITDTWGSNRCSTDLTTSLRPHSSKRDSVSLCETAGPTTKQSKTCSIKNAITLTKLSGRTTLSTWNIAVIPLNNVCL